MIQLILLSRGNQYIYFNYQLTDSVGFSGNILPWKFLFLLHLQVLVCFQWINPFLLSPNHRGGYIARRSSPHFFRQLCSDHLAVSGSSAPTHQSSQLRMYLACSFRSSWGFSFHLNHRGIVNFLLKLIELCLLFIKRLFWADVCCDFCMTSRVSFWIASLQIFYSSRVRNFMKF